MKKLLVFISVLSLVACGSTAQKKQSETATPNLSYVSAKGVTVVPQSYLWKDFKHYSKAGAVNFYLRAIKPGENIKDAISRSRHQLHHGEAVARYGTSQFTIPIRNHKPGACYFVTDSRGRPARIRPADGLGAYVFSNNALDDNARKVADNQKKNKIQQKVNNKKSMLRQYKNSRLSATKAIVSANSALNSSRSYQNNQCVLVAQRSVPPAPLRKNQTHVRTISEGYCLGKILYRNSDFRSQLAIFPPSQRTRLTESYAMHLANEKAQVYQCNKVDFSQWNDIGCNFAAGLAWWIGMGQETRGQCFQNILRQCTDRAISNCNADYSRWESEKKVIESEPYRLKSQCENNVIAIENNKKKIIDIDEKISFQNSSIKLEENYYDHYVETLSTKKYIDKIPIDSALCSI